MIIDTKTIIKWKTFTNQIRPIFQKTREADVSINVTLCYSITVVALLD